MSRPLRARLRAGEILRGTLLSIPSPEVADLLAGAGFDWLFVDAEHGAMEPRDVLALLYTVADRTPCLVRVPVLDEAWIKRVLDAGAAGIIVPQVETAEQAALAVRFALHPPGGTRGLGTARANRYGLDLAPYLESVGDQTTIVVQAETAGAVRNIAAIVQVPRVDAVFVGPFDLSASLGHPGAVTHPVVADAILAIHRAAKGQGVATGIFALTAEGLEGWVGQGFTLLAAGVDGALLGGAVADLRDRLRQLGGGPTT